MTGIHSSVAVDGGEHVATGLLLVVVGCWLLVVGGVLNKLGTRCTKQIVHRVTSCTTLGALQQGTWLFWPRLRVLGYVGCSVGSSAAGLGLHLPTGTAKNNLPPVYS